MVISRCCKSGLYIVQEFYVCERCNFGCDTIALCPTQKEEGYDAGSALETQESFG